MFSPFFANPQLLHIFGTLIKRKLIAQELSDKVPDNNLSLWCQMPQLIVMLNEEMDTAKAIFNKQAKKWEKYLFY